MSLQRKTILTKFENDGVYAPDNSVSMYKMYSSYLTIVPKEQLPIDMEILNYVGVKIHFSTQTAR